MSQPIIGPVPMILPESVKLQSSEVFHVLDPDAGGAQTFSVALSPSGAANATHWGTSAYLEQRTYDAMTTMNVTEFKAYCDLIAAERGRVAPNNVTAFKNGVVIGQVGEWFWDFATANGLKPVQEA